MDYGRRRRGGGGVKNHIERGYVVYEGSLIHQHMPCIVAIVDCTHADHIVYYIDHYC